MDRIVINVASSSFPFFTEDSLWVKPRWGLSLTIKADTFASKAVEWKQYECWCINQSLVRSQKKPKKSSKLQDWSKKGSMACQLIEEEHEFQITLW